MEIMEIIDMMEETIDKAPTVPLSGKILVDKEDLLDYIQEMRLVFPDEVKEAKWIKDERQRLLSEAESRADAMVKNAEEKMIQLVDENEITRQAYEQANQLVTDAQNQAVSIKTDVDQYADDILGDVERRLDMLLKKVHDDRVYFNNK
ncbi:MAG TPA: ATPase [Candidatus Avimonoglobus intestinipullorum]|uniref:ATPase n=1 Tax=Candidatus Avimonoglobus intestinipullorum TaxID=2840699 RepID=A0A9D1S651_9FIRM|nr:ATPase [Candidatus Avimonoglobus intestinipullorum]